MRLIQHSALPCVVHVTQPHAVYPQQSLHVIITISRVFHSSFCYSKFCLEPL